MNKPEVIGVRARFNNGNIREMTGMAPAAARRQYAFWLTYAAEAELIYEEKAE